jgi:hypothetical protein
LLASSKLCHLVETERDRERQRETERDRERQRETERDRERQRETERDIPIKISKLCTRFGLKKASAGSTSRSGLCGAARSPTR